jgi:hypothetical protein
MEYMDVEKLEELARYGMDMGCHTITHPHLPTLSDDEMHAEIFDAKKTLENMGFVIDTMVYPYYEFDDRAIEYTITANYTCARAGWQEHYIFNPSTTDPKARYHVSSIQITQQDMTRFKEIVGEASPNDVVCLVYHLISDTGPADTSTPVANFMAQMAYLKEAGFTVIPLPDLFRQ